MLNNTTTIYPSHFPGALSLIEEALNTYGLHSENWSYPTKHKFGSPKDYYYAEVWHNGMDWQSNYFIIETSNLNTPLCFPFIVFEKDNPHRSCFNCFDELVDACLHYRRMVTWLNSQNDPYHDTVWPFVWMDYPEIRLHGSMLKMGMCHASQRPVEFLINENCVPLNKIQEGKPANAKDPVNYPRVIRAIMRKKELIPLLMGIDPELDNLIEQELRRIIPS